MVVFCYLNATTWLIESLNYSSLVLRYGITRIGRVIEEHFKKEKRFFFFFLFLILEGKKKKKTHVKV